MAYTFWTHIVGIGYTEGKKWHISKNSVPPTQLMRNIVLMKNLKKFLKSVKNCDAPWRFSDRKLRIFIKLDKILFFPKDDFLKMNWAVLFCQTWMYSGTLAGCSYILYHHSFFTYMSNYKFPKVCISYQSFENEQQSTFKKSYILRSTEIYLI